VNLCLNFHIKYLHHLPRKSLKNIGEDRFYSGFGKKPEVFYSKIPGRQVLSINLP
jgi:hypothetical protein